jgi:hypothetical protein
MGDGPHLEDAATFPDAGPREEGPQEIPPRRPTHAPCASAKVAHRTISGFTPVANQLIFYPALLSHFPDERASVPGPQPEPPVRLGFPVWPPSPP